MLGVTSLYRLVVFPGIISLEIQQFNNNNKKKQKNKFKCCQDF